MIKIEKSLKEEDLSTSLHISQTHLQEPQKDKTLSRASRTTQQRRLQVIAAGEYPTSKTIKSARFPAENFQSYNSRYRLEDIQIKLKGIYNDKCAYCECRDRRLQVEHYRPKSVYYWLAYSWDNLLLACSACNSFKGNSFNIYGDDRVSYDPDDYPAINNLSEKYNRLEEPLLLNPENEKDASLLKYFKFDKNGSIATASDDDTIKRRCEYTIETCKLDEEKTLRLWRYRILEKFRKRLAAAIYKTKNKTDQTSRVSQILDNFVEDAEDNENEFSAFRQYAVDHFLGEILENELL